MSILVVRHGSAGNHLAWEGDDADRPLDPRGTAQAASLAEAFAGFPVSVVLSSRAVRCQQTVLPLARRTSLEVAPDPVLCEGHLSGRFSWSRPWRGATTRMTWPSCAVTET